MENTNQQPQQSPQSPQPEQSQAWQGYEVKKKSKKPWVIGGIALVLALCCGGGIAIVANSDSGKKGLKDGSAAKSVATSAAPQATSKKPEPLPTKGAHVPTVKDIVLKVKVTKKQCFGSAGCLVDFRIDTLTYAGEAMDKDQAYEVIYEVKGLKDPYTNTLTLNGDGSFEFEKEESGQTSTTKVALKAVVTSVDEKL